SELIRYDVNTEFVEVVKGDCSHKEDGNIFEYLKRRLPQVHIAGQEEMPPFVGGYVGYFGYELKAETGGSRLHKSEQYDAQFIFADRVIAIDHFEKKTWLLCLEEVNEKKRAETWISETEEAIRSIPVVSRALDRSAESAQLRFVHQREQYLSLIESALHEITNGESYEICLTNRLVGSISEDPLDAYLALRRSNPAPYAGYFRFSDVHILSCSPERFVSVDRCGNVESKPIKGTIRRGVTEDEDRQLKKTLELSEKDRAENLMIVDLIRNDLGKVCLTGSVKVPKFCDIETFASVHQMVTTVVGKLRADRDPIDCIRALFPGGSMTGAPKVRTMEIIDRLENMPRGIYSGSIGYLSADGTVDLNIVIRTAVLQNGRAVVGTGGALVALSNPEAEFEEIVLKSRIINETLGNSLRSDV
ncbi:aminodeoxychorismate synthase component I, partial [Sinorhizobium meliloti]